MSQGSTWYFKTFCDDFFVGSAWSRGGNSPGKVYRPRKSFERSRLDSATEPFAETIWTHHRVVLSGTTESRDISWYTRYSRSRAEKAGWNRSASEQPGGVLLVCSFPRCPARPCHGTPGCVSASCELQPSAAVSGLLPHPSQMAARPSPRSYVICFTARPGKLRPRPAASRTRPGQ